jgi:hypothetical protein
MHAERDLIIDIVAAGNAEREVIKNSLAIALPEGEPVSGRKIDARLPFLGAAFQNIW